MPTSLSNLRVRVRLAVVLLTTPIAAAVSGAAPAQAATCGAGAHRIPTAANLRQARRATLCLLNRERARFGLPRLRARASLIRASSRYAHQMVAQAFFGHVAPNGSTLRMRVASSGYLRGATSWSAAENIAWGTGAEATPASTVRAWMRSPGHRANILDAGFRDIGVGVAPGAPASALGAPAATYVTEFASRSRR